MVVSLNWMGSEKAAVSLGVSLGVDSSWWTCSCLPYCYCLSVTVDLVVFTHACI